MPCEDFPACGHDNPRQCDLLAKKLCIFCGKGLAVKFNTCEKCLQEETGDDGCE